MRVSLEAFSKLLINFFFFEGIIIIKNLGS